ncbi:hypothetical protein AMTRI_Chr12g235110 [Amborella trichopoda]
MKRLFEIEKGLTSGELSFIDEDIYNFVSAINNAICDNDAHILLTKCKQIKDKDFNILFGPMVFVLVHMRYSVMWYFLYNLSV